MNKKEKAENLSFNFHTCLRKCMDSKGASICWLSIDILDDKIWSTFIDRLYDKKISLKNCIESLRIKRGDERFREGRTSEMILFEIGLKMLDPQEWEVLNETCL